MLDASTQPSTLTTYRWKAPADDPVALVQADHSAEYRPFSELSLGRARARHPRSRIEKPATVLKPLLDQHTTPRSSCSCSPIDLPPLPAVELHPIQLSSTLQHAVLLQAIWLVQLRGACPDPRLHELAFISPAARLRARTDSFR